MVIFPLAPDQTIAQMWSNGAHFTAHNEAIFYQDECRNWWNRWSLSPEMQFRCPYSLFAL